MAIRFYESIRRVVSDYTLVPSDEYIGVGQRAVGITLTLPTLGEIGQMVGFVIKDESGQANAFNITLQAQGIEEIQGNSTYTVNVNYGSVEVFHNGTMWIVRSSNDPQVLPIAAGGTGANNAPAAVQNLGIDIRDPVRVAAKENVDLLSAPTEVNGITLVDGDSVLLWLQTDATENGVYEVIDAAGGSWQRRGDFNESSDFALGIQVLSLEGNSYAGVYFVVNTANPDIGVDDISITPLNDATAVYDAYGNKVLAYSYVEDAVNHLRIESAAVNDSPRLRAWSDTETHVSGTLTAKGDGKWFGLQLIEINDTTDLDTASDVTYVGPAILGSLIRRDPNGADRTDTIPDASTILSFIPQAFPKLSFRLRIANTADAAEKITLAPSTGITLVGPCEIQQGETREFFFYVEDTAVMGLSDEITVYDVYPAAGSTVTAGNGLTDTAGTFSVDISPEFQFLGNTIYASAIGANRLQEYITNQTGGTLVSGTAVALRLNSDGTPGVVLADSTANIEATHVVGSLDINDASSGFITRAVTFGSLDTSSAPANGAPIYLSITGGYSFTAPTGSNELAQVIGYVGIKDAVNGTILFSPQPVLRYGSSFLQDDAVTAGKISASFSLSFASSAISSPSKRLYVGGFAGTDPVVGATLSQAVSGATATITFLNDNESIDITSITGTFDATNLVTGTNPDTSTFTFTPTMTLIDCWPLDYQAAGITSVTTNDGTVLPVKSASQLLTTGKTRFQPVISITQGQIETLTSDGWTDLDVEYTRSEVVVA